MPITATVISDRSINSTRNTTRTATRPTKSGRALAVAIAMSAVACTSLPEDPPAGTGTGGRSSGAGGARGTGGNPGSAGRTLSGTGGTPGAAGGGGSVPFCTASVSKQSCPCTNGDPGTATCNASGTAFGPCVCPATLVWQACASTAECPSIDSCATLGTATVTRCLPPACASQIGGTPCPPIPASAVGVTQSCDYLECGDPGCGLPGMPPCETCPDNPSYCHLHCTATSICPYAMSCVGGICQ